MSPSNSTTGTTLVLDDLHGALDRRTVAIVAVLALAAFMSVLDGTIVTTAIETFGSVFHTSVSSAAWVSIAYLLAAGIALPTSGWAGQRFGNRRVLFVGLALFVIGSALASMAWSIGSLIACRFVQGLGGGLLEPTALTLAATMAGPRRVGRVMSVLSMIVNIAPVLGPLTGGLFASRAHWRWIFILNLPVGAVVAVAAFAVIPRDAGSAVTARPDLRGLLYLSPGFASLLFAIDRLGASGSTWTVVAPALIGIALLVAYAKRAGRVAHPVVDLGMLRTPGFAAAVAIMSMVGLVMYSQLASLPLFLSRDFGYGGIRQGLLTTALGIGLLFSMSLSGRRSDIVGPRPLVTVGAAVTGIGLAIFAVAHDHLAIGGLVVLFIVIGLGFGTVAAPTFSSIYRTVPNAVSQATTTLFIVVQTSASLGVTIIGLAVADTDTGSFGPVFFVLALAMVVALVIARRLPGRPLPL